MTDFTLDLTGGSSPASDATITETVSTETFEKRVAEADAIMDKLLGRITDVAESTPYRKVLLYGDPGVGKTVFTATAPTPLIIRVEPTGTLSLNNHPDLAAQTKTFEFVSVVQLETLLDKIIEKPDQFKAATGGRETLVIDSFSELQKVDLDDIVRKAAAADASRNKYLPTGPDYNINTEHMRQIGTKLERIPMNVIVTCHVKEEKDDATGRLLVRPNLTPKLAGTLAGKFDVVAYMAIKGSGTDAVRTLQTAPSNTVTAKTRIGGIPAVVENPTWNDLFSAAK